MRLKNRIKVQKDLDKLKKCSEKMRFSSIRTKFYIKNYELHKYRMRNNLPGSSSGEEDMARTVSHKPRMPHYCWKAVSLRRIRCSGKHDTGVTLSMLHSIDKAVAGILCPLLGLVVQERQRKRRGKQWDGTEVWQWGRILRNGTVKPRRNWREMH